MNCTSISKGLGDGIEMSLDEYISKSKIYVSPTLNQPKVGGINPRTSRIEDPDDDDNLMDDIDDILTKNDNFSNSNGFGNLKPNYLNNIKKDEDDDEDVNHFNSSQNFYNGDQSLPVLKSQQWRLIKPNLIIEKRPAGMPPLVMRDAAGPFNVVRRNRNAQNSNNTGKTQKQNMKRYKNQNRGNANVRGRNMMSQFSQFLNGKKNNYINGGQPQDISISVPAESVNRNQRGIPNKFQSNQVDPNANIFANAGNIRMDNNLLPMLAKNLLVQLQGAVAPTIAPSEKYDLNVQKEIHMLQKKPFVLSCGNVEKPAVLSYDGPGLNQTISPSSTGITFNQRFS